jgi:prefoldin subunit 5
MTTPKERVEFYQKRLGELALERLKLSRRLEELDRQMAAYEAAAETADGIRRDLDTQAAVAAAKENNG